MSSICSVCISKLGNVVCVPCSNFHQFHQKCLMEWASTLNNCPMCREEFTSISLYKNGVEIKKIQPPKTNELKKAELFNSFFDPVYETMACELCFQSTDDAQMLICDVCNLGYHMYCLEPPVHDVPLGMWECEQCRSSRLESETEEENILYSEDERVLNDNYYEDPNVPSTSCVPTIKELRKSLKLLKSKRKSKKTKRKTKSKKSTSSRKRYKKRKCRKSKRLRHVKTNDDSSAKVHQRIADVCGIDLNHSNRYKVVMSSTQSTSKLKTSSKLDLFGTHWVPPPDDNDNDICMPSSSNANNNSKLKSSLSLLDEIFINQTKVLAPGKLLKINRDGTLHETDEYHKYLEKQKKKLEKSSLESTHKLSKKDKKQLMEIKKEIDKQFETSKNKNIESSNNYLLLKEVKSEVPFTIDSGYTDKPVKMIKDEFSPISHNGSVKKAFSKAELMVLSTSCNTDCSPQLISVVASTSSTSTANDDNAGAKKGKNRTTRWKPAKSTDISDSANNNLDPINLQQKFFGLAPVRNISNNNYNMLPTSYKLDVLIPSPSSTVVTTTSFLNNSNGQAPFNVLPNLSTEPNSMLQHLFSNNTLLQSFLASSTAPLPTSTTVPSTTCSAPASSMAAMFAAAMSNSGNNSSEFDLLNPQCNQLLNAAGLLNPPSTNGPQPLATFLNCANHNLSTGGITSAPIIPTSQPLSLPTGINSNADLLGQIFKQQVAAAAAALNPINFSTAVNNSFLFGGSHSSPPSQQQQLQSALLNAAGTTLQRPPPSLNLPPPILPIGTGRLSLFSPTNVALGDFAFSDTCIFPPPPPSFSHVLQPPQASGVRCGVDSPMDIDDGDDNEEPNFLTIKLSHHDLINDRKDSGDFLKKEDRSETVKQADAAMKVALKPYFVKRMISKDEYKEIMKKGVAKLREKDSLKPEKVGRFVKQYVDLIAKRRKK